MGWPDFAEACRRNELRAQTSNTTLELPPGPPRATDEFVWPVQMSDEAGGTKTGNRGGLENQGVGRGLVHAFIFMPPVSQLGLDVYGPRLKNSGMNIATPQTITITGQLT